MDGRGGQKKPFCVFCVLGLCSAAPFGLFVNPDLTVLLSTLPSFTLDQLPNRFKFADRALNMFVINTLDRWVKVAVAAVLLILEYIMRLCVTLILRIFPVSIFQLYVFRYYAGQELCPSL